MNLLVLKDFPSDIQLILRARAQQQRQSLYFVIHEFTKETISIMSKEVKFSEK